MLQVETNSNHPIISFRSAFILWNSRLVHQGATYAPYAKTGFRPPVQAMWVGLAHVVKFHITFHGYKVAWFVVCLDQTNLRFATLFGRFLERGVELVRS